MRLVLGVVWGVEECFESVNQKKQFSLLLSTVYINNNHWIIVPKTESITMVWSKKLNCLCHFFKSEGKLRKIPATLDTVFGSVFERFEEIRTQMNRRGKFASSKPKRLSNQATKNKKRISKGFQIHSTQMRTSRANDEAGSIVSLESQKIWRQWSLTHPTFCIHFIGSNDSLVERFRLDQKDPTFNKTRTFWVDSKWRTN